MKAKELALINEDPHTPGAEEEIFKEPDFGGALSDSDMLSEENEELSLLKKKVKILATDSIIIVTLRLPFLVKKVEGEFIIEKSHVRNGTQYFDLINL